MSTLHTPGPWRFRLYLFDGDDLALMQSRGIKVGRWLTNDGEVTIMGADRRVCVVAPRVEYKRGKGHEVECAERDANARLIAAAPELLEALSDLLDALETCRSIGKLKGGKLVAENLASAAIDKATKETK